MKSLTVEVAGGVVNATIVADIVAHEEISLSINGEHETSLAWFDYTADDNHFAVLIRDSSPKDSSVTTNRTGNTLTMSVPLPQLRPRTTMTTWAAVSVYDSSGKELTWEHCAEDHAPIQ